MRNLSKLKVITSYSVMLLITFVLSLTTAFAAEIKSIYIECDPAEFDSIYQNYEEDIYISAVITYEAETWDNVRMRIRGDDTRKKPKKSLKLKFDSKDFYNGRSTVNLNAEYEDPSYIRQYLCTRMYHLAGIDCYNTEHYMVYINGEYSGLYLGIENMDEQFMEARDIDEHGTLYKATVDGACMTIYDDIAALWEQKVNMSVPNDDLIKLIQDIHDTPAHEIKKFISERFVYDDFVKTLALNMILSNTSTYYHNYYLYHDITGTGKWQYLPWDMDKSLSHTGKYYVYTNSSRYYVHDNPLVEKSLMNDEVLADIRSKIVEMKNEFFNAATVHPIIDSLQNVLEYAVANDKTDNIQDLQDWKDFIQNDRLHFRDFPADVIDQIDNAPRNFEVFRMPEMVVGKPVFRWRPSVSPSGSAIEYILYYGPSSYLVSDETIEIEGIKDTTYTLNADLDLGRIYWGIRAKNSKYYTDGFDSYNYFEKAVLSTFPCSISENMTLTADASPYLLDCEAIVEDGAELTIEPGVTVITSTDSRLLVNGILNINGTESNPVIFRPQLAEEKWLGIRLDEYDGNCNFKYMIMENGIIEASESEYMLRIDNASISNSIENENSPILINAQNIEMSISNSKLEGIDFVEGIFADNCKVDIIDCELSKLTAAIKFRTVSGGSITGCRVIDIDDIAIELIECDNIHIKNNILINANNIGISVGYDQTVYSHDIFIERNQIARNDIGLEIKGVDGLFAVNNTFYANNTSVQLLEKSSGAPNSTAELRNCILSSSHENDILNTDDSELTISYCLSNTTELEGDNNQNADPKFIHATVNDFRLRIGSPCIDSGDPDDPDDPDGSRVDIGALPYEASTRPIVINEINYNSADDFDPGDWVELYNPNSEAMDLSGWIFRDDDMAHEYILPDGTIIPAYGYLVLCGDKDLFSALFPDVTHIGNFDFGLSGSGDMVRLFDSKGNTIDSVLYDDKAPWPTEPDGEGATLELTDYKTDNSLAQSWNASEDHGTPGRNNSHSSVNLDESPTDGIEIVLAPHPAGTNSNLSVKPVHPGQYIIELYDLRGRMLKRIYNGEITADGIKLYPVWPQVSEGPYLLKVSSALHSASRLIYLSARGG